MPRYGGEEFVVLLPRTSVAQAREVAERLRMAVQSMHVDGSRGDSLRVTVSQGIGELGPDADAEAMMRRADAALYEAKRSGRNRTMVRLAQNELLRSA